MTELLTALLVGITGFYAYATYKILRANESAVAAVREQSEALTRPYLIVSPYLPPKGVVLYLRIRNAGKTAANDLRLKIDRDFFRFGKTGDPDHNLASYNAFNLPIPSFPPDAELLFYLAQGFVIFGAKGDEEGTPKTFAVTATYSYGGRSVTEETQVDLRPFLQSTPPPDPLVDKLEEIRKELKAVLRRER